MKKYFMLLFGFVFVFSMVACGQNTALSDGQSDVIRTDSVSDNGHEVSTNLSSEKTLPSNEADEDIILISQNVFHFGGKLSEEYKVEVVGFGNPVPLMPPLSHLDYPEKGEVSLGSTVSNVPSDHPGVSSFDIDEVKFAICSWIELAINYEDAEHKKEVDDLQIRPEDWKLMFWENKDGEMVLFVELKPSSFTWRGETGWRGLYEFRVTKRNP